MKYILEPSLLFIIIVSQGCCCFLFLFFFGSSSSPVASWVSKVSSVHFRISYAVGHTSNVHLAFHKH